MYRVFTWFKLNQINNVTGEIGVDLGYQNVDLSSLTLPPGIIYVHVKILLYRLVDAEVLGPSHSRAGVLSQL